jgi:hypothetical protein
MFYKNKKLVHISYQKPCAYQCIQKLSIWVAIESFQPEKTQKVVLDQIRDKRA